MEWRAGVKLGVRWGAGGESLFESLEMVAERMRGFATEFKLDWDTEF